MTELIHVFAGDCTVTYRGDRDRTQRGHVVVVAKPDHTVLVHDVRGYQPVAWLTRAEEVSTDLADESFRLVATAADQTLTVESHGRADHHEFPATEAGVPVGVCPDCDGALVRTGDGLACLGCDAAHPLPTGATLLDEPCPDCGLPTVRVERGEVFEVCVDYACESLNAAVADALDRRWACPGCGGDLRGKRARGRVFLGCEEYPDCETTFSVPAGVVVGDCPCGLAVFETAAGRRCLDPACDRYDEVAADAADGAAG